MKSIVKLFILALCFAIKDLSANPLSAFFNFKSIIVGIPALLALDSARDAWNSYRASPDLYLKEFDLHSTCVTPCHTACSRNYSSLLQFAAAKRKANLIYNLEGLGFFCLAALIVGIKVISM